jgi:hypothetical protein
MKISLRATMNKELNRINEQMKMTEVSDQTSAVSYRKASTTSFIKPIKTIKKPKHTALNHTEIKLMAKQLERLMVVENPKVTQNFKLTAVKKPKVRQNFITIHLANRNKL